MNVSPTIPKIDDYRLLQANGAFHYRFEELAIEIEPGYFAGSFNGTAEVTYWNDEDGLSWFVGDITLECGEGKTLLLEQRSDGSLNSKLYLAIWSELNDGSFRDFVEAHAIAELE